MPPKSQQNQEDQPESAVTDIVNTGQVRSEPVSGDDFVKAMTSIRRSFRRVKEAAAGGELEAIRKAVEMLGRGLEGLEKGGRG